MTRAASIVALHFALFLSLAGASEKKDYDREIARQRRELEDLKGRLEHEQKDLDALKERKAGTLERIDRIAGNLRHTEEYLAKLDATEQTLDKSVAAVRGELGGVERRIEERNAVMAKRVRALFISGGPDRMILEGWEPGRGDFLRKIFFMKRILSYDRSLVDEGRRDAQLKRGTLDKLDGRLAELARFRDHKAKEKETYARARREQERSLATIQSNEESKREALKELEENARLINDIIASLEKRRKEEEARHKKATVLETGSKYCLPVEGEVVSKYGLQFHSTLKTTTKNLGIEIQGKSGMPVRAAVSGEVALITRIPGYGMGVILDNGSDVFTIYANLAGIRVRPGDKVRTCEEIASVSTETSRVYFEVRKATRTLDPVEWLHSSGK